MSYPASTLGNVDKPEYWVENLWLPLVVTIVGGLILTGLASIVSRTVRRRFWRPIGRGLRWLTTLRLTTTGKVAADRETANEMIREQQAQYVALRDESERKLGTAQVQRAALTDQVEAARGVGFEAGRASAAAELKSALADGRAQGRAEAVAEGQAEAERARAEGYASGRAEAEQARAEGYAAGKASGLAVASQQGSRVPASARVDVVVEPVWHITQTGPKQFWLENVQEGVGELADVRIEAVIGEFSFSSGNQWPGTWGRGAGFSGELVSTGTAHGARMEVSWTSPDGRRRKSRTRVEPPPKEPRRAVIL